MSKVLTQIYLHSCEYTQRKKYLQSSTIKKTKILPKFPFLSTIIEWYKLQQHIWNSESLNIFKKRLFRFNIHVEEIFSTVIISKMLYIKSSFRA